MLQPALDADPPVHLVCREDSPDHLVAQLSTHGLDVVISDAVAPPHVRVRAFNHLLGESGLTFFASTPFARRLSGRFPRSLDGVPMLLPSTNTTTRRALDDWFETVGVRPRVVAEFEDSALMKAFGEGGGAVFVAPTAIGREVSRHYNVRAIGRTEAVRERYYAISVERRLTHPGVLAITHAARGLLPMPAR
jgi:LysR family transcriptional activator of nhaA